MKQIVVASLNPVKGEAALGGFRRMFPQIDVGLAAVAVPSGVADQPSSNAQTQLGASNRCGAAARLEPEADFWVGIEGGIEDSKLGMAAFAWVVVRSDGRQGRARSATFFLPRAIAELVRAGHELGAADDLIFGRKNSKQHDGAVGLLTHGIIDRRRLYEEAMVMALIPFRNPDLF